MNTSRKIPVPIFVLSLIGVVFISLYLGERLGASEKPEPELEPDSYTIVKKDGHRFVKLVYRGKVYGADLDSKLIWAKNGPTCLSDHKGDWRKTNCQIWYDNDGNEISHRGYGVNSHDLRNTFFQLQQDQESNKLRDSVIDALDKNS